MKFLYNITITDWYEQYKSTSIPISSNAELVIFVLAKWIYFVFLPKFKMFYLFKGECFIILDTKNFTLILNRIHSPSLWKMLLNSTDSVYYIHYVLLLTNVTSTKRKTKENTAHLLQYRPIKANAKRISGIQCKQIHHVEKLFLLVHLSCLLESCSCCDRG